MAYITHCYTCCTTASSCLVLLSINVPTLNTTIPPHSIERSRNERPKSITAPPPAPRAISRNCSAVVQLSATAISSRSMPLDLTLDESFSDIIQKNINNKKINNDKCNYICIYWPDIIETVDCSDTCLTSPGGLEGIPLSANGVSDDADGDGVGSQG